MDFTISIPQANAYQTTGLFHHLMQLPDRMEKLDVPCEIVEKSVADRYFYTIQCRLKRRSQEREVRRAISEEIARYMCTYFEEDLIKNAIQKHYPQYYDREIEQIKVHTNRLFQKNTHTYFRTPYNKRSERLAKPIFHFLRESKLLAVDGYVCFRLEHYRIALAKCVHDAVDQFLLDQEYQDFISLLKYFVSVQGSKMDMVHIMHRGVKEFELVDEQGKALQLNDGGTLQEIVEHSFSHEDLIVSTLLTIAPEKIVLHSKFAEENIIRTLTQIFESRLVKCKGCNACETAETLDL
ncbi:putative sporulation protein YtxC [Shimazuella kribbensis]|uniref:putative sporulation protein YtxC n=1 Tax=Shimazuella kribbensis TaxID=139808 RepID=UPI0003F78B3D|nr:putative sporulation protein YtxC [Shimazuella kribbensis]